MADSSISPDLAVRVCVCPADVENGIMLENARAHLISAVGHQIACVYGHRFYAEDAGVVVRWHTLHVHAPAGRFRRARSAPSARCAISI